LLINLDPGLLIKSRRCIVHFWYIFASCLLLISLCTCFGVIGDVNGIEFVISCSYVFCVPFTTN
jgi:hypothetical protein